jgi:hypothetical protein
MNFSLSQVLLFFGFFHFSLNITSPGSINIQAVYEKEIKEIESADNFCYDHEFFEEKSYFIPLLPDQKLIKLIFNHNEWDNIKNDREILEIDGRYQLILGEHPGNKEIKPEIKPIIKNCITPQTLYSFYTSEIYSEKEKDPKAIPSDGKEPLKGAMLFVRKRRNLEPLFRDHFRIQDKVSLPKVKVGFLKTNGENGFDAVFRTIEFQSMIVLAERKPRNSHNYNMKQSNKKEKKNTKVIFFNNFLRIPYDLAGDLSSNVGILIQEEHFFNPYIALNGNKGNGSCLCITLESKEPLGIGPDISWFGFKKRSYSWLINDGSFIMPDPPKDEPYFNILFRFTGPEGPAVPLRNNKSRAKTPFNRI